MSKRTRNAMQMMEKARPVSGYRPETPQEWDRLLIAFEELGFAMYCDLGMSTGEARRLAKQTHSGQAGLVLLQIGFEGYDHE
jgi:hypothetical protein